MNIPTTRALLPVIVLLALTNATGCAATSWRDTYVTQKVNIPMRDGVKLYTEITRPRQQTGPLPFLMTRTPYGPWQNPDGSHDFLDENYAPMLKDGYIFVFQDIRGCSQSEGEFVMLRPLRDKSDPDAIDETTDTYDTIEWLLKNTPNNNGKVGMLGVSYPGWLAMMALIDPHPALKAVSPQASPCDMFIGDDFAHNGALRLSPSFGYGVMMEAGLPTRKFPYPRRDVYEWFLELGPLSNANRLHVHGKSPTWNNLMQHPDYDAYWRSLSLLPIMPKPTIPVLNVGGWFDAEDFYGALKIYDELEKADSQSNNQLVVGPWYHGAWRTGQQQKWNVLDFESPTAEFYRDQVQRAWFAHYLHGAPDPKLPEALVFETGGNRWAEFDHWPPTNQTDIRPIYLHADGSASFTAPTSANASVSYISDPAKPVPYQPRPIPGFWQGARRLWKIDDQRFVDGRPDVATWTSPPLDKDVVITGEIVAEIFAATTGSDSDFIVKLIDVYPDDYQPDRKMGGYQLMIAGDVMRARYRNSFSKPEAMTPNQVTPIKFSLHDRHHRFRAGHRIMVQIQSTWFPLIDRNPQTFVNIPTATAADYQSATQTISCAPTNASRIVLPILRD